MGYTEEHPDSTLGLDCADGQLVVLHVLTQIVCASRIPLLHFAHPLAFVRQEGKGKRLSLRHEQRGLAFRELLPIVTDTSASLPNSQRNSLIKRSRVVLRNLLEVFPEVSLGVGLLAVCGNAELTLIKQVEDVLRERRRSIGTRRTSTNCQVSETLTALEGITCYILYILANGQTLQAFTIAEHAHLNVFYRSGQRHLRQTGAIAEHTLSHFVNTVGQHNFFQRRTAGKGFGKNP